jgi:anti-sigma factor RsiW
VGNFEQEGTPMAVTGCPTRYDLERLLLGEMHDNESDAMASHLAVCTECLETLRSLECRDTLVDALRRPPSFAVTARALAERLRQQVPPLRTVAPNVPDTEATPDT